MFSLFYCCCAKIEKKIILNVMTLLTDVMLQPASSLLTTVALPPSMVPRPAARPWSKDLRLYEEYKLRRNELRLRSLNRRREQEKTVPQPLLSDIVSEPCEPFLHTNILRVLKVFCSIHCRVCCPEGARASREDQTEGGPMEGEEETPGLS